MSTVDSSKQLSTVKYMSSDGVHHVATASTTQLVRDSLIHDNWKLIESKKSPLFSTMVQFSVKSLVPPSLPFLQVPYSRHYNQTTACRTGTRYPVDHSDQLSWSSDTGISTKLSISSEISESTDIYQQSLASSRSNFYQTNEKVKIFRPGTDGIDDPSSAVVNSNSWHRYSNSRDSVDGEVTGSNNDINNDDSDRDEEVELQVISSLTHRKLKQRQLPEFQCLHGDESTDTDIGSGRVNGLPHSGDGNIVFGSRWPVDNRTQDECDDGETTTDAAADNVDNGSGDKRPSEMVCKLRAYLPQLYSNMLCQSLLNKPLMMFVPESEQRDDQQTTNNDIDEKLSDLSSDDVIDDVIDGDDVTAVASHDHRRVSQVDSCAQMDDSQIDSCRTPVPPTTVESLPAAGAASSPATPSSTTRPAAAAAAAAAAGGIDIIPHNDIALVTKSLETSKIETITEGELKFVKKPSDQRVSEGDNVKITCQLQASQPVEVYWFRDTAQVTSLDDDDRCETHQRDNCFTLELYNVTRKDTGYYLCVGIAADTQCTHRFLLMVTTGKCSSVPTAPTFLQSLKDIEVQRHENIKLTCQVSGTPTPQVTWFTAGNRLKHGNNCSVERLDAGRCLLTIYNTSTEHNLSIETLQVSVVARNVAGHVSSSCVVKIITTNSNNNNNNNNVELTTQQNLLDSGLYPDVKHLMELAEKASVVAAGDVTPRTARRKLFGRAHAATLDNYDLVTSSGAKPNLNPSPPASLPPLYSSPPLSPPPVLPDYYHSNSQCLPTEEMVDVELTYQQFQALYDAGLISSSQLSMGQVARSELQRILDFLHLTESEATLKNKTTDHHEAQLTVDCGLKRVDSSRYRRDYVINRKPGDEITQKPVGDVTVHRSSHTKTQPLIGGRSSSVSEPQTPRHSDVTVTLPDITMTSLPHAPSNSSAVVQPVISTVTSVVTLTEPVTLQVTSTNPVIPVVTPAVTQAVNSVAVTPDMSSVLVAPAIVNNIGINIGDVNNTNVNNGVHCNRRGSCDSNVRLPSVKELLNVFTHQTNLRRVQSLTTRQTPQSVIQHRHRLQHQNTISSPVVRDTPVRPITVPTSQPHVVSTSAVNSHTPTSLTTPSRVVSTSHTLTSSTPRAIQRPPHRSNSLSIQVSCNTSQSDTATNHKLPTTSVTSRPAASHHPANMTSLSDDVFTTQNAAEHVNTQSTATPTHLQPTHLTRSDSLPVSRVTSQSDDVFTDDVTSHKTPRRVTSQLRRCMSSSSEVKAQLPPTPTISTTTRSARALFWQKKLLSGMNSDCIEEFPELPLDSFKSSDV